eukprot:EC851414.1.p1 GENE.EC851414.1~~EC851414.1.p1  ORF type:complete len:168 (+),score=44.05 EC851414.1:42-506(+)
MSESLIQKRSISLNHVFLKCKLILGTESGDEEAADDLQIQETEVSELEYKACLVSCMRDLYGIAGAAEHMLDVLEYDARKKVAVIVTTQESLCRVWAAISFVTSIDLRVKSGRYQGREISRKCKLQVVGGSPSTCLASLAASSDARDWMQDIIS